MVLSTTLNAGNLSCQYWFDENFEMHKLLESEFGNFEFNLNCFDQSDGFHMLYYRFKDSNGNWSRIYSDIVFVRNEEPSYNIKFEYWLDDINFRAELSDFSDNTLQYSLNVRDFTDGYHVFNGGLSLNGKISSYVQQLFYKLPTEANNIEWCRIWWNDFYDKAEFITLDNNGDNELSFSQDLKIPDYILEVSDSENKAILNVLYGSSLGSVSDIISSEIFYTEYITGIKNTKNANVDFSVSKRNGIYYAENLVPGLGSLTIFDINGEKLFSSTPQTYECELPISNNGIYIITYKNHCIKLVK